MIRLLLILGMLSLPAQASETIVVDSGQKQVAVVELYTSEGCHSCPPADRWLNKLEATLRDDFEVLPLAFHVDYWNYLGWKDRFSSRAYTSRQRQLGTNNQQRTIYHPGIFRQWRRDPRRQCDIGKNSIGQPAGSTAGIAPRGIPRQGYARLQFKIAGRSQNHRPGSSSLYRL